MQSGEGDESVARLERRLAELRNWQDHSGPGREECAKIVAGHRALADALPLVHGVEGTRSAGSELDRFVEILQCGELRSKRAQGGAEHKVEHAFGIANMTYTAAGILYPDKSYALVFRQTVEHPHDASASPWDTGKFFGTYWKSREESERVEAFHQHTLPSSCWRRYLAERVGSLFPEGLRAYVGRRPPSYGDPAGFVVRGDPLSWTFEVRLRSPVRLDPQWLVAVFVLDLVGASRAPQIERALKDIESKGVEVFRLRAADADLRAEVSRWIWEHYGEGGSS